jgi:hypothetical protein
MEYFETGDLAAGQNADDPRMRLDGKSRGGD